MFGTEIKLTTTFEIGECATSARGGYLCSSRGLPLPPPQTGPPRPPPGPPKPPPGLKTSLQQAPTPPYTLVDE